MERVFHLSYGGLKGAGCFILVGATGRVFVALVVNKVVIDLGVAENLVMVNYVR